MPHEKKLSSSEQIWHVKWKDIPEERDKNIPSEIPRKRGDRKFPMDVIYALCWLQEQHFYLLLF